MVALAASGFADAEGNLRKQLKNKIRMIWKGRLWVCVCPGVFVQGWGALLDDFGCCVAL